ncbi:MAG: hypothetical protein D6713_03230 [Deltaproteobacteria bacterium]|nr:MAG: hypothetical protein D6713_03230 [Deltaproteobacteria bacterium]
MKRVLLFLVAVALIGAPSWGRVLPPGAFFLSGKVVLREPLIVPEGTTLYVAPGTRVSVEIPGNGEEIQAIVVAGKIVVDGRPTAPVVVTGRRGWGEIYLDGAVAVVENMVVENPFWGFHVHESTALFRRVVVRGGKGGIRSNGTGIYVYDSEFLGCDIALRYLNGGPVVRRSRISGVRVGIFFREGVSTALFRENEIGATEYLVRVGDFASGYLDVRGNYWGTADPRIIGKMIFDGREKPLTVDHFFPLLTSSPLKRGASLLTDGHR